MLSVIRMRSSVPLLLQLAALASFTLVKLSAAPRAACGGESASSAEPPAASDIVRDDWYRRESLVAIADWEAILAYCERHADELSCEPVFPLPSDGRSVRWHHPIPPSLRDAVGDLALALNGDRVDVRRASPAGNQAATSQPLAEAVHGDRHFGGGGDDRWYHHYRRRFDRLGDFCCRSAGFALELPPVDFTLGSNTLSLTLRNVTNRPLALAARVRLVHRQATAAAEATDELAVRRSVRGEVRAVALDEQSLELAAGEARRVDFALPIAAPGGGLAVVSIDAPAGAYAVPLLWHVEDVPAVLAGIARLLADAPDAAAALRLADLRARVQRQPPAAPAPAGSAWRQLFAAASALRDELLLGRLGCDRLLLLKRQPFDSEQPFMDAHHCYNRPGGAIYCLAPPRPDGHLRPLVDSLGLGIYRDLCLHWDGRRLLFAFGNGADRAPPGEPRQGKLDYDLYEADLDSGRVRQLTRGPANDCEPCYLPDGQIAFTSDRPGQVVMCGSDIHVASLHLMDADGGHVRQLGFNVFNEFNPSVLPDGRIVYNRWEYNERSVTSLHKLFTVHPDGTHAAPFYGNATIRPNVTMFPRAVPGSALVTALFTAHHGQTHGPIGLVDPRRGLDGPAPVTLLTPGVPVTGEKAEDSAWGWYGDPWPLAEDTYLCAYTPSVVPWLEASWSIYVGDRHGNLALVYRDPHISCAEPQPLAARPTPPALPPAPPDAAAEATLLVADVYEGLPDVPRGTVKFLRVLEDVPRQGVPTGGVICTSLTPIYTVKRIVGTVPVEPDGSAHFTVPAERNLYFEVLDERRREIQRMRSVVCLQPLEQRTCIGCHEPAARAPRQVAAAAFERPASRPAPAPWGQRTLSFLRDVQPVLDRHCVACHAADRRHNRVVLAGDLTDQFCIGYEELLPFLSVANAKRWDHPQDVYARPPYTYGSGASALVKLLEAGHHGVALSPDDWERLVLWIDANGVYYDRYETYVPNRAIFAGDVRERLDDVFVRRCAACHDGERGGHGATWWLSLNRADARASRALVAPLARSAGGWQSCAPAVFADAADPDYRQLLAAFESLAASLADTPRADLRSLDD